MAHGDPCVRASEHTPDPVEESPITVGSGTAIDRSCSGRLATPRADEIRRLLHALREPVGAFAINVALLDDEALEPAARQRLNAMISNVERMTNALAAITKAFRLEVGDSTPLPLINGNGRDTSVKR
jgi:hypothetical protein